MDLIRLDWVQLQQYKCFEDTGQIALGPINVLVGENNSGKSTVIQGIRGFQVGWPEAAATRLGAVDFSVTAQFSGTATRLFRRDSQMPEFRNTQAEPLRLVRTSGRIVATFERQGYKDRLVEQAAQSEPDNVLYPFLARRRLNDYSSSDLNRSTTIQIVDDMRNLPARVSRLSTFGHPAREKFLDSTSEIIGFPVTTFPVEHGQKLGRTISAHEDIALEEMGTGVANLVALIATLCAAEGRIILIEEPESDLHPSALKKLVRLMIESAEESNNQIVVSTHSHLVVRHLGAADNASVLRVDRHQDERLGRSTITPVDGPSARQRVLHDLGYELFDFGLHEGWLILEESSAEAIVREYLIPWFHPYLARLRTVAANGADDVQPTFAEHKRLVTFSHLEEIYRDRTFVMVDGDDAGTRVVQGLSDTFSDWDPECFIALSQENFELYYPERFRDAAIHALSHADKRTKRALKRELIRSVRSWCDAEPELAKPEFERSASEVIIHLARIEERLRRSPTAGEHAV